MQLLQTMQSWQRVFAASAAIFFIGSVVRIALPGTLSRTHIFGAVAALLVLRLLMDLPAGVQRASNARRLRLGMGEQLKALVPVEVIALFRLEQATQKGFFAWVLRKSKAGSEVAGEVFEHHRKSQYSTVFIIILVMCITEVPLSFLLLDVIVKDPLMAKYLHWFLLFGVAYTLVLLTGDRQLVWSTRHVVASGGLELQVGERFAASIPWSANAG